MLPAESWEVIPGDVASNDDTESEQCLSCSAIKAGMLTGLTNSLQPVQDEAGECRAGRPGGVTESQSYRATAQ